MIEIDQYRVKLQTNRIDVWTARIDDHRATTDYGAFLDDFERERAARFVAERDHVRFVLSHGILRLILSGYLGSEAADLRFIRGTWGKPQLTRLPGQPPLEFSLSHSGDYCMVAVGLENQLGVDLEKVRVIPQLIDIARRYFTLSELRQLSSLTGAARQDAFFTIWTQKEAIAKALGQGLADNLDALLFDGNGNGKLQRRRECYSAECRWSVTPLFSLPGYAAAVASLHSHPLIEEHTWNAKATIQPNRKKDL